MQNMIWYISVLIVVLTLLVIILLRMYEIEIASEYKYLASAIGISGFTFAILGDGLFVIDY